MPGGFWQSRRPGSLGRARPSTTSWRRHGRPATVPPGRGGAEGESGSRIMRPVAGIALQFWAIAFRFVGTAVICGLGRPAMPAMPATIMRNRKRGRWLVAGWSRGPRCSNNLTGSPARRHPAVARHATRGRFTNNLLIPGARSLSKARSTSFVTARPQRSLGSPGSPGPHSRTREAARQNFLRDKEKHRLAIRGGFLVW